MIVLVDVVLAAVVVVDVLVHVLVLVVVDVVVFGLGSAKTGIDLKSV